MENKVQKGGSATLTVGNKSAELPVRRNTRSTCSCSVVCGSFKPFRPLVFGLFTRWFRAEGLLLGWVVGIGWGSWTAWSNGLKPLATIDLGGASYVFYVGLGALALNIVVAAIATVVVGLISPKQQRALRDAT
jgi:hypothetical protein